MSSLSEWTYEYVGDLSRDYSYTYKIYKDGQLWMYACVDLIDMQIEACDYYPADCITLLRVIRDEMIDRGLYMEEK